MEAILESGPNADLYLCYRCLAYDENLTPTSDGWMCRDCVRLIFEDDGLQDSENSLISLMSMKRSSEGGA